MCVKVSDMVLPPITGLYIIFGTYILRLWAQWEDNSTHPSLPYSAITLQIGCLGQFLKLHLLRKRNMCMEVSDTVLPPITGVSITFGTYMEALGTMGREFNTSFFPYPAITLQIGCLLGQFLKLHPHFGRETCAWKSQTWCYHP